MPRAAVEAPKQDAEGEEGELQAEHRPARVLARGDWWETHGGEWNENGGRQPENRNGAGLGKGGFYTMGARVKQIAWLIHF